MSKIILIDDDPTYAAIMKRCAELESLSLEAFTSLSDLGSVGCFSNYDIAIVDYDLGELTGLEIGAYLDALFGSQIPMILVSNSEAAKLEKNWPKSIKGFVSKSRGYAKVLEEARRIIEPEPIAPGIH